MPLPALNPVAEDKTVPASENHRRPTHGAAARDGVARAVGFPRRQMPWTPDARSSIFRAASKTKSQVGLSGIVSPAFWKRSSRSYVPIVDTPNGSPCKAMSLETRWRGKFSSSVTPIPRD